MQYKLKEAEETKKNKTARYTLRLDVNDERQYKVICYIERKHQTTGMPHILMNVLRRTKVMQRHHNLMSMLRAEKRLTPQFEVMTSIIGTMTPQAASYHITGNADAVAVVDIIFII